MRVPSALTSFIGRRDGIPRAVEALRLSRLVTITGVGGVGKTRLAYEVAAEVAADYPDGVHVVELDTVPHSDGVAGAVVDTLGLAPAPSSVSAAEQLADHLADKRLLLVLDNCEHVLDGCRTLVGALLRSTDELRVLASSREQFLVAGERLLSLQPLPTPPTDRPLSIAQAREYDALVLLEQRAGDAVESFGIDESTLAAAVQVCARLDGLPLAIELAVGRLRSMSLTELADRLDHRFALLRARVPAGREQHRALTSMVAWSWDLCTAAEQRLWARMSVFTGGCDLNAILAVCVDEGGSVLDDLDALVTKSVVLADATSGVTRYRMLDTLAAFGHARLVDSEEEDVVRDRHAAHFRELAATAGATFHSPAQLEWSLRLGRDRANLAAAFEHVVATDLEEGRAAVELAGDLRYHMMMLSPREGERMCARAVDRYRTPDGARMLTLLASSLLNASQAEFELAEQRAEDARRDAEQLGSPVWLRRARLYQIAAGEFTGAFSALDGDFDRAAAEMDPDSDLIFTVPAYITHLLNLALTGDVEATRRTFDAVEQASAQRGEVWLRSYADCWAALTFWANNQLDDAFQLALESLRVKYEYSDVLGMDVALSVLAAVAARRGDDERAAVLFGSARAMNRAVSSEKSIYGPVMDGVLAEVASGTRDALGTDAFDAATARGATSTWREICDYAAEPPVAPATGRAPSGHAPLTDREFEVASLVATGLTNRGIADRLVLSPRTVDGHLERILAKLALPSRAAVAAWVVARPGAGPG